MNVQGKHYLSAWFRDDVKTGIDIIDQTKLPHQFVIETLHTSDDVAQAIKDMHVRGAILIGIIAAYAMALAALEAAQSNDFDKTLKAIADKLKATRPTAVNLAWGIDLQLEKILKFTEVDEKVQAAIACAKNVGKTENEACRMIGLHGLEIIKKIAIRKKGPLNILTHCNAGWLACLDYGTATAPIYAAHDAGIDVHVWVDETRPWNQGARLTAWELGQHGVPHTIIADNTGGHLMQHNKVDMVIVGSDRTTRTGDVANKIGTYLKALAAQDNKVPFYVALPASTFDWSIRDGLKEIPIEQRGEEEVKTIQGLDQGLVRKVLLTPESSPAANYGFDVTPAGFVTGLISERGVCQANEESILTLYPEQK